MLDLVFLLVPALNVFFNDHSILFFSLIYTLSLSSFSLRLQELGTTNRLLDASMESIIPATTGRRLRSLDTFRGLVLFH